MAGWRWSNDQDALLQLLLTAFMSSAAKQAKLPAGSRSGTKAKDTPHTQPVAEQMFFPRLTRPLLPCAFFLLFYFCLWKWVEVGLIYHGGGHVQDFPAFYWGSEFARDFWTHPGGLVEYGSAFIAQSMYLSWLGALV